MMEHEFAAGPWINVGDGLPDTDRDVLVRIEDGCEVYARIAWHNVRYKWEDRVWEGIDEDLGVKITHWAEVYV